MKMKRWVIFGAMVTLAAGWGYCGQWLKSMTIYPPVPYTWITDITADDFDNLYVIWVSTSGHTIEKRNVNGNVLFRFGADIPQPRSLYSDGGGNVYVMEALPAWPAFAIRKYSSSGALLQTFTANYFGSSFFVDSAGNVYVPEYLGMYSYRLHKYNPSFNETRSLNVGYYPAAVQPTPSGTLYIMGTSGLSSFAIYEYDANLNYINTIIPSHFSAFGGWAAMKTPHLFDAEGNIQAIAYYPYSPYNSSYNNPQIFYRLDSSFNISESQSVPLIHGPTAFDGKRMFYSAYRPIAGSTGSCVYQYIYDRAPEPAQYVAPIGAVGSPSAGTTLTWNAASDPDGDVPNYSVFLGTDPANLNLLVSTQATSVDSGPLSFGVTYYWQVNAQDSYLGIPLLESQAPVASFNVNFVNAPPINAIQPDPYNYPNPFQIGQGTNLVFTASSPVDGLKISVYSVHQDLVWRESVDSLTAGVHQFHWDGNDANGHAVYSGLYVAVFDSSLGRKTTRIVGVR